MITKTSEKHLVKALKARLGINSVVARSIVDRNWYNLPHEPLKGCVVEVRSDIENRVSILVEQGGYYMDVGYLKLTDEDLAKWKLLPIEEAYALPEGVRTLADCFTWTDGKVLSAEANDELSVTVEVELSDGTVRTMAMLADLGTSDETLAYAETCIGKNARLCIEFEPVGTRQSRAGYRPILEMVSPGENIGYDAEDDLDLIAA